MAPWESLFSIRASSVVASLGLAGSVWYTQRLHIEALELKVDEFLASGASSQSDQKTDIPSST